MSAENLVPAIRFKGFSGAWVERKLINNFEKIIDFRGRTPKKLGFDWSETGYLALSALNVKNGFIDFNTDANFGGEELYDKWMSGNELHKNQVLFTTEAPMGNVAQVPNHEKYILSQRTIAFEVNPKLIEENFLAVTLRGPSVQRKFTSLSSGGTAQGVSQKSLATVDVIIPDDIAEQTKIGNYFQQLDTLIALHQQKHDKLLSLKKALLEKMFPKQGEKVPAIRFKGFSGEWEEKALGDLCDFFRGKHLSWSDIQNEGKYECVLYGHLYTDYGMVIKNVNYTTNTNSSNLVRSCSGDILIPGSDTTPTGLARATSIEKNGVILGGDINILRPKGFILGSFLSYNINTHRQKLIKLIKGTTVKHLVNSDLQSVELFISNEIDEQKKITVIFEQLDSLLNQHQVQLKKLNNIKQACLEKMFV